ncbi:MAG: hypothetical protein WCK58_04115 [Chloroflexota bacterium]
MTGVGELDFLPIWAVFGLTFALSIGATELGYRTGLHWQRLRPQEGDAAGGVMVGATLAMLAFFLAFLVGMAVDRFDGRRAMVMDEANSIGTTWLRAGYLPDEYPGAIRPILEQYTAQRLRLPDNIQRDDALAQSTRLASELWAQTEQLVRDYPNSESVSLFTSSVNDTIDMGSKRAVAMATWRIPGTIWLSIYVVALLTMMFVGIHGGITKSRNVIEVLLLALVFAAVMNLIIDLDRPYDGMLQVSQEALRQLQASFGH